MGEKTSVLVLIDGARADALANLMREGHLPNMLELAREGSFEIAASSFPTTTGSAHLPFLTGKYPGDCNIPGGRWYKDGVSRSYFSFGKTINSDIDVETIFQSVPSATIFSPIMRGASYKIPNLGHLISHMTNHWLFFDKLGFKLARMAIGKRRYQFIFLCLYAIDELSHRRGAGSNSVLEAYRLIDSKIAELKSFLDSVYEDYQLVVSSDHGITDTHTHINLVGVIKSLGFSVRSYPFNLSLKQEVFVAETGNSMANIYFTNKNKKIDKITSYLRRYNGIDLIAYREDGEFKLLRGESEAVISGKNGAYRYEPVRGDPLELEEYSGEWIGEGLWYEITLNSQYPDSVVQIAQIFKSDRAGDLIVTARNGYDLRTLEIPEHRASHGSFNREHMLVPVISNQKISPGRTAEIYKLMLDYLRDG